MSSLFPKSKPATKKKSTKPVTTKLSAFDKELIEGYVGISILGQLEKGKALKPEAYKDLVKFATKQKMKHLSKLLADMRHLVTVAKMNNKRNEDTELN